MIPHEYLNALDALPSFVTLNETAFVCGSAELNAALPSSTVSVSTARAVVWLEPQVGEPIPHLVGKEQLIIIASRSLARLLPERQGWRDAPLGMRWGGLRKLKRQLNLGWTISAEYHFHSLQSILLNVCSQQLDRWGQPARADRWHFFARQQYITRHRLPATVSLLFYVCLRS